MALMQYRFAKRKHPTPFGIMAFLVHVAVAFGIPLAFFGTDGWDLPVF